MEKSINLPKKLIIFVSLLLLSVFLYQVLPVERTHKMTKEIERIRTKTDDEKLCVQYALVAVKDGFYPCYKCKTARIFLKRGEVWKYGKTCIGKDKRYSDLDERNLTFIREFKGTEKQCLIIEKQKIYNYAILPENLKRAKEKGTAPLLRPPGNKIDR